MRIAAGTRLDDFRGLRRDRIVAHHQIKRPDDKDYHGGHGAKATRRRVGPRADPYRRITRTSAAAVNVLVTRLWAHTTTS